MKLVLIKTNHSICINMSLNQKLIVVEKDGLEAWPWRRWQSWSGLNS